jgi:hypothetical protein
LPEAAREIGLCFHVTYMVFEFGLKEGVSERLGLAAILR